MDKINIPELFKAIEKKNEPKVASIYSKVESLIRSELDSVGKLLSHNLADELSEIEADGKEIEAWLYRLGTSLTTALTVFDFYQELKLPPKDKGTTEKEREIKLKVALHDKIHLIENLKNAIRCANTRISFIQSILKVHTDLLKKLG